MVAPTTRESDADDLLTVDQLAEATGVSVRTIRFYSGKGLLPAPRLRGRTGLYDTTHRARLELIGELSALGFTLAAIEKRLERVPHHAGPEELALQLALLTPWTPEDPEDVDGAGLETLSPDLPPELSRRAQELIDRHTTALAEDLMTLFQDEVLQPYRERGRPSDERSRLAAALARLKPVTVQGVVTAFGRAVNRTIRDRVGNEG
ncbi:MerR family transcriptional regulator [Pseudonocardia endophytica]|uniref:DNA-binding transcriptional MerR regulator n=1 Tax=Pseudonocardia endophytica TaxID=401976 RepID=A0A4R1HZ96_PSEEN|nr:MerR family transcriptional regulator [Pseudonocardia endophytica]TCK26903.1 DNA-binding transcriptional MerR regulator [Pseudonocardia endophytica]